MTRRIGILAVCAALAFGAAAQDDTVDPQARKEIGQCYSRCSLQLREQDQNSGLELLDMFWETWRSDITEESWNRFLDLFKTTTCVYARSQMSIAANCYYGCFDIEQSFGSTRSSARSAFLHEYRSARATMVQSGLWSNYNDYPDVGTPEFDAACDTFFDSDSQTGRGPLDRMLQNAPPRVHVAE